MSRIFAMLGSTVKYWLWVKGSIGSTVWLSYAFIFMQSCSGGHPGDERDGGPQ